MDETKFEALDGLVTEVDAEGPQTPEQQAAQQAEAQALDSAQQWGSIVYAVGTGLALIAPELRSVYTPDACNAWGQAMQPVAEKHGWNSPANVPEFGLLLASVGLGVPTFLAIRARLVELKRERESARPAAPDDAAAAAGMGLGGTG